MWGLSVPNVGIFIPKPLSLRSEAKTRLIPPVAIPRLSVIDSPGWLQFTLLVIWVDMAGTLPVDDLLILLILDRILYAVVGEDKAIIFALNHKNNSAIPLIIPL